MSVLVISSELAGEQRPRALRMKRASVVWAAMSARVYLPAFSIIAIALGLLGLGWADHFGGANLGDSVSSLRIVVIGPLTLVILGVLLVVERLRPAQRRPLIARGHRHDLLYTVLNATLTVPFVAALTMSFADVVHKTMPWLVMARIGQFPRWAAISAIFIAMDGCNWLAHAANHRIRMLWRFHELHHSQEDMSVLTVFRTHPMIHVSYLIALIPGIVLVANGTLPTMLLVAYGGVVAFAHSNTNLGFGPFDRILVSPNYHRIHHKLDGPQDVNLGFALTIWDQMFRRAVFPSAATIRTDTGLPGRPLVVEQAELGSGHLAVFIEQLLAPFRPMNLEVDLPPTSAAPKHESLTPRLDSEASVATRIQQATVEATT